MHFLEFVIFNRIRTFLKHSFRPEIYFKMVIFSLADLSMHNTNTHTKHENGFTTFANGGC